VLQALSVELNRLSFNFCLSEDKFFQFLHIKPDSQLTPIVHEWFTLLCKSAHATVFSGLEFLGALTLLVESGTLEGTAACLFDMFDFDQSGEILGDVFYMMLKTSLHGLSKVKGEGEGED
jgi:hypothetical protein